MDNDTAFRSTHNALSEVEAMRATETGFAIHYLPFGGINWAIGNAPSPDGVFWRFGVRNPTSGEANTLEEALVEMVNAARAEGRSRGATHIFFANCDIALVEDQRTVEDVAYELRDKGLSFSLNFDATITDPSEPAWTVEIEGQDHGYGGDYAREALLFALSET